MCLIKDLIDGQIQRNCSIVSIIHTDYNNVLNREISLIELLKASFMSANKNFSLIKPIKDANEVGQRMRSVEHCKVVFSTTNRSHEPVQNFEVLWHFNRNFPEQFIEIFKNSRKEDWPEHIVVMPVGLFRFGYDMDDLSKMERDGYPILENIWPNAKEICPDLSERPMEIVHPKDGRRLTIEYTINLVHIPAGYRYRAPCYKSSVTFKTI